MTKILLVCSAGMSTSILVQKMIDAAKLKNIQIEVSAKPMAEAKSIVNDWDVILLAPQVRFIESNIKSITTKPVAIIPPNIYALAKGEETLDLALSLIK